MREMLIDMAAGDQRGTAIDGPEFAYPFEPTEEAVRSESAADITARRISQAILSGVLTPGTRLARRAWQRPTGSAARRSVKR